MKALKITAIVAVAMLALSACSKDSEKSTWEDYADWRNANVAWLEAQEELTDAAGAKVYERVSPTWNSEAYVLMRWFNDREATSGNLRPLFTSTVDVKYIGRFYNKEPFDSSYRSISPADSIFRTEVGSTIPGWVIAMEQMHVGDSVEVIVPYQQGYGASKSGKVKPYSTLVFNIKLVDVAGEYVRP